MSPTKPPIKISIIPALANITSVFSEITPNRISTDDIKAALFDIYGTSTKIIVSQFPDLLALIAPEIQLSIIAEGRRVQIINQKAGELEGQATENYLKLVSQINQKIAPPNKLTAFGLNYSAKIELVNGIIKIDSSDILIKLSVNELPTVEEILTSKIINSSFHVVFMNGVDRLELRLDPELSINLKGTNKINATLNVHQASDVFPTYGSLLEKYKTYLTKFQQDCDAVIHQII